MGCIVEGRVRQKEGLIKTRVEWDEKGRVGGEESSG